VTAFIVFICAGTPATGAGHLSRCLALAEAYREGGWRVEFIVSGDAFAALFDRDYRWHVAPSGRTLDVLRTIASDGCDVLVIDDYALDESFEAGCRGLARRLVVLDDQTGRRHRCDVLIDAAAPDETAYRGLLEGPARVLTGARYALIRSHVLRHRRTAFEARRSRKVSRILLSFGATDAIGLTQQTIDAIGDSVPDGVTLVAALSSRAPGLEALRSRNNARLQLCVDADMGEIIAAADLAVGAGGVGAFERAALGLPGIVVTAAENQRGVAQLLVAAGAALDGGEPGRSFAERLTRQLSALLADEALRERLTHAASMLVDGRAAERIRLLCADGGRDGSGADIRLRAAEFSDEEWLLALQREPDTRRYARNPEPPSPQEHRRWLAAILEKGVSKLSIVEVNGTAAGMVRLDRLEQSSAARPRFEISIAVSTTFHGRGIGSAVLRMIRAQNARAVLDAFILPENEKSLRTFRRAGYIDAGNGFYISEPDQFQEAED
jgi:UDP-2,4-diacetamido-2,4,6-trideoxy-beta-L-altropyranose hydrolase